MSLRLVLDTNVVLDLFVFSDPSVAPLHRALTDGQACWFADEPCRAEFARVLAYPRFALSGPAIAGALAGFDLLARVVPQGESQATGPMPRCSDADDQKFLDLASRCDAHFLVTKDGALLELARRVPGRLRIVTPKALMLTGFPDLG
jgi:predicted nucleic acid-binding protein